MKRKPKILVVGSFVKDLIVSTDRFPDKGETVLGKTFHTASGGKGANQAVQAARMGAEVTIVGKVGDDAYGKEMIDSCAQSGIDCRNVMVDAETPSSIGNVQLQVGDGGKTQNRIIVVPGANMKIKEEEIKFLEDTIGDYDMVLLQMEIPMEINEQVARYAQQKKVPVMLNSAPSGPISSGLLQSLTYISPNQYEAEDLTGIPIRMDGGKVNEEDVKRSIDKLLEMGVRNVLITLGTAGAAFGNQHSFFICPTIDDITSVDPTGAGDSFVGAFCTLVAGGVSYPQAVRIANYVGSLTVTTRGAQPSLPTLAAVEQLIRERGETELLQQPGD